VLCRWYKAKGLPKQACRPRVGQATGQVSYQLQPQHRAQRLFRDNRGFVTVMTLLPWHRSLSAISGAPISVGVLNDSLIRHEAGRQT